MSCRLVSCKGNIIISTLFSHHWAVIFEKTPGQFFVDQEAVRKGKAAYIKLPNLMKKRESNIALTAQMQMTGLLGQV